MSALEWTCKYCDKTQISTQINRYANQNAVGVGVSPPIGSKLTAVRCLNPACGKVSVDLWIGPWMLQGSTFGPDLGSKDTLFRRSILPEGSAKPVPDFVPQAIRDDYTEACLIRDLSPKASATLARRCIQGMIRDFAQVSVKSKRLIDEIKALEKAVEEGTAPRGVSIDSIEALTAVRKIGNIGAHMEADIDLIIDVDPGEAQVLINLIESLIDDWYIERQKRSSRFASAIAIAAEKQAQIERAKLAALPPPDDGAA